MADEKPADSAQAPAETQAGTQAAAPSPDPAALQVQLQQAQAEREALRSRLSETQKAFHQRNEQAKRLEAAIQSQGNGSEGYHEQQIDPIEQERIAMLDLLRAAGREPAVGQLSKEIFEILGDPARGVQYEYIQDPAMRYVAVARDLKAGASAKELVEANAKLAELTKSRDALSTQAIVSGTSVGGSPETITEAQLRGKSPEELEAMFGKEKLLQGLYG